MSSPHPNSLVRLAPDDQIANTFVPVRNAGDRRRSDANRSEKFSGVPQASTKSPPVGELNRTRPAISASFRHQPATTPLMATLPCDNPICISIGCPEFNLQRSTALTTCAITYLVPGAGFAAGLVIVRAATIPSATTQMMSQPDDGSVFMAQCPGPAFSSRPG
jgi:hypothetical protein